MTDYVFVKYKFRVLSSHFLVSSRCQLFKRIVVYFAMELLCVEIWMGNHLLATF